MTRAAALSAVAATAALLAACAEGPPPAATARAGTATAAATAAPITRFDGRYVGTLALQPDRTRRCPEPPNIQRELLVQNGRARFMFNPEVRQVLTGTVGEDGSVRLADSLDRTIATSGVLSEGGFQGEHRNGFCSYSVQMTKRS